MKKQQLKSQLLNAGIELTDNLSDAIYMFDCGVMVSGEFCDGIRGTDHNILRGELPNSDTYEMLHDNYAIARLVPETKTALVSGLPLSDSSIKRLANYGYTIERY